MTQYSLPQDGTTGDGGTYEANIAQKELVTPYYIRDNPANVGLYVEDVTVCGNSMCGFLVKGEAQVNGLAYVTDSEEVVTIPYDIYSIYALVLVDNSLEVSNEIYADNHNTVSLLNNEGSTYKVDEWDISHRYIKYDAAIELKPNCYIMQYFQRINTPPKEVSNTTLIQFSKLESTLTLSNQTGTRPNEFTLSGMVCSDNVPDNEINARIRVYFESLGSNYSTRFVLDGTDVTEINPLVPYISIVLGTLYTPGIGTHWTHLTYELLFTTYKNHIFIKGIVVKHILPQVFDGVMAESVEASKPMKLSGRIYTDNYDWKVTDFEYDTHSGVDYGADTCIEVTYK